MLSFVCRVGGTLCILILLVACSRSHIPLQFEGSEAYSSGLSDVDAFVERFHQQYSFKHVDVWVYDLMDVDIFRLDGTTPPPQSSEDFNYPHAAHTVSRRIKFFYQEELAEHGNYAHIYDYGDGLFKYASDTPIPPNLIHLEMQNSDKQLERIIYGTWIDENFVVIDAY